MGYELNTHLPEELYYMFLIRIIPTIHFSILPSTSGTSGTQCQKQGNKAACSKFSASPNRKVNTG